MSLFSSELYLDSVVQIPLLFLARVLLTLILTFLSLSLLFFFLSPTPALIERRGATDEEFFWLSILSHRERERERDSKGRKKNKREKRENTERKRVVLERVVPDS